MIRSLRKMLCLAAPLLCLVVLTACNRGEEGRTPTDNAALDSAIRDALADFQAAPAAARRRLSTLAAEQTDTAARLRVGLYDAVVGESMGDTATAEGLRRTALDYSAAHPEARELAGIVWNHRGVSALNAGDIHTAAADYEQACRILDDLEPSANTINTHINAADARMKEGNAVAAADHYRRALFLADSLNLNALKAPINAGLGEVYCKLENYREADRHLREARRYLDSEGTLGRYYYYTTRGNCHFFTHQYDEALAAFDTARTLADGLNMPFLVTACDNNIGETLLRAERTREAAKSIGSSLACVRSHPEAPAQLRFYTFSLAADLALEENRLADAARLLRDDIDTTGVHDPVYIAFHYKRLQRYHEKRGDWKEAYRYASQAEALEDSIRNQQTLNNIIETRNRFEQDTTLLHQRVVIADYEAHAARQHMIILTTALAAVTLLLIAAISIIVLRHRAERRYNRAVLEMGRLRMSIIQNRIQPHFIFNVLGTMLPKFSNVPELSSSISLLIDVLRTNLLNFGKTAIALSEERRNVEQYVSLHSLSKGSSPDVRWSIGTDVPPDVLIPAMSLQIAVENALKHAFPTPSAGDRIDITIAMTDDAFFLSVTDNGTGYNPGAVPDTGRDTGTGLRVLSRTIELLNTHNAAKASFSIGNRTDGRRGTRVEMVIPRTYKWDF